jgi:RNA polymerase sigma factor (sigma-70 family)
MSAPARFRLDPFCLGLDDLGLLVRHPRAPESVRRAFVQALDAWVRRRVATLTRRMRTIDDADRDDLVQDFLLACLTRHLRQWQPARATVSAYLFARLRCLVIDRWRRRRDAVARDAGDDVDVASDTFTVDAARGAQAREACCVAVAHAVAGLPVRQRAVMRGFLRGDAAGTLAWELRLHPSTVSRDRTAALAALRAKLAPSVEAWELANAAASSGAQ